MQLGAIGEALCDIRMVRPGDLLLDVERALEQRLGLREAPRAHIDVGDEIESLTHCATGSVPAGLLADREGAFVVVLRLGVAAFAIICIAEIFDRIAEHQLIAVRRALDNAQGALLNGFRLGVATLMLIHAAQAVESLRKVANRCGARLGLFEDRKRELVELLRLGILP